MPYKNDRPCIYGIYCKGNDKLYIGSSETVYHRLAIHKSLLRGKTHFNIYLQRAYNKYGEDSFQFTAIEEVEYIDKILEREQWYIDSLNTLIPNGFNIAKDTKAPMRGRKHSKETKERLKILSSGKNNGMYGKKHSKDSIVRMSTTRKENMNDDLRKIMSENAKKRIGKLNAFYGKSHNDNTKNKIRNARHVLNKSQVLEIRELLIQKITHKEIGNKFGVSRTVITNIALGNTYKEK